MKLEVFLGAVGEGSFWERKKAYGNAFLWIGFTHFGPAERWSWLFFAES